MSDVQALCREDVDSRGDGGRKLKLHRSRPDEGVVASWVKAEVQLACSSHATPHIEAPCRCRRPIVCVYKALKRQRRAFKPRATATHSATNVPHAMSRQALLRSATRRMHELGELSYFLCIYPSFSQSSLLYYGVCTLHIRVFSFIFPFLSLPPFHTFILSCLSIRCSRIPVVRLFNFCQVRLTSMIHAIAYS